MSRGIHPEIIAYCINHRLLYESRQYHNAVFVVYDQTGAARYAALRGTIGTFKGEASGSDKHYSFSIAPTQISGKLHLFESAIDLLSHATLELRAGHDWQQDNLLSLAGVYKIVRENVVPVALERFLSEHPEVQSIHLHLDNDAIGRSAAMGIMNGLKDRYEIFNELPSRGKDVNELLQIGLGIRQRNRGMER